ncbi:MAG: hypothetical protein QOF61_1397 [Acidobacteriota bacterium]|jgi:hypothetical protein|nr:hypothetical protein [Acidobacteriota bacterium]
MQRLSQARPTRKTWLALSLVLAASLAAVAWRASARPRVWAAGTVPVAFWVWGNELPAQEEIERAASETKARVLFVRAGQLHAEGGRVSRVRAPTGKFPRGIPIHLVYNGTRALLASFAQLDARALASSIAETYRADLVRAEGDCARVSGLQLDLDVPTRLLPRYAELLRALRGRLPTGTQLSVTGLTTWMNSPALPSTLDAVDFWIPQFYGARIPETLSEVMPVSSPASVARDAARARALNRPFYAGVAAYGYAALYSKAGALVEIRGDLDPDDAARDPDLELVERRPFETDASTATSTDASTGSEWRYVFRAQADTTVCGLFIRAGEQLMIDVPSAETLRASLRSVREQAGGRLIGVCLFRLPAATDRTALTLAQVVAALADRPATSETKVQLSREAPDATGEESSAHLCLTITNDGMSGALLGEALTVTLGVPAGSVGGIAGLENFENVETLCGDATRGGAFEPCSARRANAVRLRARAWRPGAKSLATLSVSNVLPSQLPVEVIVRDDDGRVRRSARQVLVEGEQGR